LYVLSFCWLVTTIEPPAILNTKCTVVFAYAIKAHAVD
jgi:hypothetical protein